jgi:16S rRNA (guanine(966)-N(2))-methyltransferase RsmD
MGIEAVSRGAERAVLVDENRESASVIEANIRKTGSKAETAFFKRDVFKTLGALGESHEIFDIIFMDPPYASAASYCTKAAEYICRYGLLRPGGLFIVEHAAADAFPENVMNLTLYRRCKYGSTMLTFYTTDAL